MATVPLPGAQLAPFDPLEPHVLADPYPHYARLQQQEPVHWGLAGDPSAPGCWYMTRYADVVALLKDPRLGREIDRVLPQAASWPDTPSGRIIREWMVLRDPPDHTLLRGLVHRAFTPQIIERWAPRMREIAVALCRAAKPQQRFDFLAQIARPFPVLVVAELLGVPGADAPRFTPWTQALAQVIEFEQSPEIRARGEAAMDGLANYLAEIIAARRLEPQADLISALLAAEGGTPPSDTILIGACTQLLFGGNDPVTHLLGNGLWALSHHRAAWQWLWAQAATPVATVDELMRYDSSVQMTFRYVLEELTWAGRTLRQGDLVALVMGAANRDPRQFDRPEELLPQRSPNRHLSLGQGIHFCLGAALARQEACILLDAVRTELPGLAIAEQTPNWQPTVAVRGLQSLWVEV